MNKTPVAHQDLIAEGPEARCGDHRAALTHLVTITPWPDNEAWDLDVKLHKDVAVVKLGPDVSFVANARDTLAALNRAAESLGQLLGENLAVVPIDHLDDVSYDGTFDDEDDGGPVALRPVV